MNVKLIDELLHVKGGYIIKVRYPFGPSPSGYGEVVCKTLDEAIDLIRKADEGVEP